MRAERCEVSMKFLVFSWDTLWQGPEEPRPDKMLHAPTQTTRVGFWQMVTFTSLATQSHDPLWWGLYWTVASKYCWNPYRVFSITWPASMQIYWNKRKRLHKKRVQLPQDWFGTPTWLPLHCFGTPIWPPWRHVKTLYSNRSRCRKPLFQSEASWETNDMKTIFLFSCNKNSFTQERFRTWPRFESESFWNSEMVFSSSPFGHTHALVYSWRFLWLIQNKKSILPVLWP